MKVAVLMGGAAPERETSLQSGKRVCQALTESGHEVVPLDTTRNLVSILRAERPDIVFSALRGFDGESGAVQGLLEFLDIPCVGAPSHVCRDAWDKGALPGVLEGYRGALGGTMTASWPRGVCLARSAFEDVGAASALDLVEDRIPGGYPVCVKPAHGTSARGVHKANSQEELVGGIMDALAYDDAVIIQQWIDGVELAVFVLGEGLDAFVLPPVEIVHGEQPAQFAPPRPASFSQDAGEAEAIRTEVERAAMEAYLAYGMRDLGCVNLVWDGAQARVLEVDTAPELTEGSLFDAACNASSLTFKGVVNALVGGLEA